MVGMELRREVAVPNNFMQEEELSVCLLVTNFDAPTGGIQKNSRLILSELSRRGIKTFVCARNYYNLPRNEIRNGTEFRRSPIFGSSMRINAIIYLIDCFFWLIKNRKRYDVIHCQQMFGPTMAATVTSFLIRKPILTRVTTVGDLGEVKAVRQMPLSIIRLKLLHRVSRWIALTGQMKTELKTLDIAPEKIRIINNATEIPEECGFEAETRTKYRQKLNLEYAKYAVFTGRLSLEKGLDTLIRAWKIVSEKYPDAHLLLLGEGGEYRNVEADLKNLTVELNVADKVHFHGYVSNPKEYVLASDLFVLPSEVEGMSNSLVEAFACGAVVTASDIESNWEICQNGVNCLLAKFGDENEWARVIIRIFESPESAQELARKARALAEERLSVNKMVSNYLEVYREMLASEAL